MGEPHWREITDVTVPDQTGSLWTPALSYVVSGKLYRMTVPPTGGPPAVSQTWTPEDANPCTADGDATLTRQDKLFLESCAGGALIAKIGGGTADTRAPSAAETAIVVFAVGRHCVFSLPEKACAGALYLGMNDTAVAMSKCKGSLQVKIEEAL